MNPVRALVLATSSSVTALGFLLSFLIFTEDVGRASTVELGLLATAFTLSAAALGVIAANWTEISEWADEDDDDDERSEV